MTNSVDTFEVIANMMLDPDVRARTADEFAMAVRAVMEVNPDDKSHIAILSRLAAIDTLLDELNGEAWED